MKREKQNKQEFIDQDLREEWFSVRVWNGILTYNLKTVKHLYDYFTSADMLASDFGEKSREEIEIFFKNHQIDTSVEKREPLPDIQKIITERTMYVN